MITLINTRTTREILNTAYFDGFSVVLRDKKLINKRWIDYEVVKILTKSAEQKVKNAFDKFYYSFNKTDTKFEIKCDILRKDLGLK